MWVDLRIAFKIFSPLKCQREITCSDLNCDSNADCFVDGPNQAKCICNQGFKGS